MEGGWSKEKPTQQSLGGQPQAQPQVSNRHTLSAMTWQKFLREGNLYIASEGQTDRLQQQIQTRQLTFVKKH